MVYLYAADISTLKEPLECKEILEEFPPVRRQKLLSAKQKQKRQQSMGATLLLERVLAWHGSAIDMLEADENGKPKVKGLCFNLSHSGDYVICAVSKLQVGCDIEQIRPVEKRLEERVLSAEERGSISGLSGEAYDREFLRIWTKKESFLKMKGIGLRVPLDTLEIKDCHMKEYDMTGYRVTVCAEENEFAELAMVTLDTNR